MINFSHQIAYTQQQR